MARVAQLGAFLTLLLGPGVPTPAPESVIEALQDVEITHDDQERSGFRLTFALGRADAADRLDYPLVRSALLQPFSRLQVVVTLGTTPTVLMDGVITYQQVLSGD